MRDPVIVYLGFILLCYFQQVSPQQNGDLRLVGGSLVGQRSGRLEVYTAATDEWGTVCSSGFTAEAANTTCRQLGYAGAERYNESVMLGYGPGTGPILLTQVQCDDDTNHILRCRVRGSSSLTSECNHENDVGVICSRDAFQYEGGVRLVDGPYRSEGRVEVFIFNQWYTLCGATRVSQDVAAAVCHQLSYTHNDEASVVSLTNDVDFTWNTNLNCMFSTPCFSRCYQRPSSMERVTQFCSPATSIYVKCGFDLSISQITPIGTISQCMLSVPEDTDEEETSGGLSGGAVAGIVIGSFVIVGFIIFFIVNKDAQNKCRKAIEDVRARLRNYRNSITDSLRNCCNRSARNNTTSAPTTNEIPTGSNEPTVSITPPHEDVTLTAVSHIPGTDANKPPDYNDALKYRKSFDEGYPEPSLVDQPPSYDSVN